MHSQRLLPWCCVGSLVIIIVHYLRAEPIALYNGVTVGDKDYHDRDLYSFTSAVPIRNSKTGPKLETDV